MESLVEKYWLNKRVLVTGHTGFKGTWLCLLLEQLGARVCGLSLAPEREHDIFNLVNIDERVERHVIADIRDTAAVNETFADFQPEVVFHLAAQPLVRYSYDNPVETYDVNVMGTLHILEACRNQCKELESVVLITTDKCYENKEQIWPYREIDPMGGHDPYSSSKGCCELLISSYVNSYFTDSNTPRVASARAGNVIGGGDWADDRLIPDIIRAKLANEKVTLRNPGALRPWQHVLEPLWGYLLLAQGLPHSDKLVGGWNFGPRDQDIRSVESVVRLINEKWDQNEDFIQLEPADLHEAHLLKLDSTKANSILGWNPILEIDECTSWIVEWYKAYSEKQDIKAITDRQVARYLEKTK